MPWPIHVIPFVDDAIVFVPDPTATHWDPLFIIQFPWVENIVVPNPHQLIPSYEYAIEFVPEPTATHI